MIYLAELEARVAGIPCLIGVIEYKQTKGSYSRNAPSDIDYRDCTYMDWEILDSRGRKASWLQKKVTNTDEIENKIINYMEMK
jgi:hypothetical protein